MSSAPIFSCRLAENEKLTHYLIDALYLLFDNGEVKLIFLTFIFLLQQLNKAAYPGEGVTDFMGCAGSKRPDQL